MLGDGDAWILVDGSAWILVTSLYQPRRDAWRHPVGGTVLQMTRDLSRVKVLMTHSKSLTPAQQNWPPFDTGGLRPVGSEVGNAEDLRVHPHGLLDRPCQPDAGPDE